MKKTFQLIFALCLIAVIIVLSCKQKSYNDLATTTSTSLFSALLSTPQSITINAGRDTVVYGKSGTMIHYYPNSFKDINGNIITSGSVNVQLTEMYKPGDMICNGATTVANNQLLQSGGQMYIKASMGTQEVYANKYSVSFKQSTSSTQPMALFYGNTSASDSGTMWSIADTSHTSKGAIANSTTCNGFNDTCYYVFDTCVNFHWVNCDYILDTTHLPLTTVSVVLPDTSFHPFGSRYSANTQIYLILPKTNTIILLRNLSAQTNDTVSLNDDGSKIPIGWNYEIAVVANKNGSYFYWQTSGVSTSGLIVTAAMAQDTQEDIKVRIGGL